MFSVSSIKEKRASCYHSELHDCRFYGKSQGMCTYVVDEAFRCAYPLHVHMQQSSAEGGICNLRGPGKAMIFRMHSAEVPALEHHPLFTSAGVQTSIGELLGLHDEDCYQVHCVRQPLSVCRLVLSSLWHELGVLVDCYPGMRSTHRAGRLDGIASSASDIIIPGYPGADWVKKAVTPGAAQSTPSTAKLQLVLTVAHLTV